MPASSAVVVQMNGPLWYSGPGIKCVPPGVIIKQRMCVGIDQARAAFASMSFGRPVDPPDVIAFHGFDDRVGKRRVVEAVDVYRFAHDNAR